VGPPRHTLRGREILEAGRGPLTSDDAVVRFRYFGYAALAFWSLDGGQASLCQKHMCWKCLGRGLLGTGRMQVYVVSSLFIDAFDREDGHLLDPATLVGPLGVRLFVVPSIG
jgi:hypothetical protein